MSLNPITEAAVPDERFRCGTLLYSKAGLFVLFSWLLWGDFCFHLMEAIWPNILPLILSAEGTPNIVMSLVITTIPSAMNFVLNPIISTAGAANSVSARGDSDQGNALRSDRLLLRNLLSVGFSFLRFSEIDEVLDLCGDSRHRNSFRRGQCLSDASDADAHFPERTFGQFCAANAMCGALATIIGGILSGIFLDILKGFFLRPTIIIVSSPSGPCALWR